MNLDSSAACTTGKHKYCGLTKCACHCHRPGFVPVPVYVGLPVFARRERAQLYRWMSEEEVYAEDKFDTAQRNEHDDTLRSATPFSFWIRQINQYYDRVIRFLDGATTAREAGDESGARAFEMRAQQAAAKAMMTAKGFVESTIRVYGNLPEPGVPSGEIREWKEVN